MLTGLLIAILIIGTATAVGGGFVYAVSKRKQLGTGSGSDAPQLTDGRGNLIVRDMTELRVGDIIQYAGIDYLVEGVVAYDEDGHKWSAGRIVDGRDIHWLVVGMERVGSKSSMRLMQHDPSFANDGYPSETMHKDGVRYQMIRELLHLEQEYRTMARRAGLYPALDKAIERAAFDNEADAEEFGLRRHEAFASKNDQFAAIEVAESGSVS